MSSAARVMERCEFSNVGRTFRGLVVRTIVRGTTAFRDGAIVSEPVGRLIKPRRTGREVAGRDRERSVNG